MHMFHNKLCFMYSKNTLLNLIHGKILIPMQQDRLLPPTSKQLRFHSYRFKLLSEAITNIGLVILKLHVIFHREVRKISKISSYLAGQSRQPTRPVPYDFDVISTLSTP